MDMQTNRSNSGKSKVITPESLVVALTPEEILAKNALKKIATLILVEKDVLKVVYALNKVSKYSNKRYDLTPDQIARILNLLAKTYESTKNSFSTEVQSGLFD